MFHAKILLKKFAHVRIHIGEKPEKCDQYEESFIDPLALRRRIAVVDRLTPQEYFEPSTEFLYNYFLHESNSQGLSVSQLDVLSPSGDKFKLRSVMKCGHSVSVLGC